MSETAILIATNRRVKRVHRSCRARRVCKAQVEEDRCDRELETKQEYKIHENFQYCRDSLPHARTCVLHHGFLFGMQLICYFPYKESGRIRASLHTADELLAEPGEIASE